MFQIDKVIKRGALWRVGSLMDTRAGVDMLVLFFGKELPQIVTNQQIFLRLKTRASVSRNAAVLLAQRFNIFG
jgi:hypothetical protein